MRLKIKVSIFGQSLNLFFLQKWTLIFLFVSAFIMCYISYLMLPISLVTNLSHSLSLSKVQNSNFICVPSFFALVLEMIMNNLLYIAKRVNAPLDYNSLGKFSYMQCIPQKKLFKKNIYILQNDVCLSPFSSCENSIMTSSFHFLKTLFDFYRLG